MQLDSIHPELQSVFKRIPTMPFHKRLFLAFINGFSKITPRKKSLPGVTIEEHLLVNAKVRVYKPEDTLSGAAMLWMHGGGYILGSYAMNDTECSAYARQLKIVVVSVEYRLAPKHPFPAALDDCLEAWTWMQTNHQQLGIDPAKVVISGQSAGAGLAAGLTQRLCDMDGVKPAAQALIYPMLDDRTAADTSFDVINHKLWNNISNRAAWSWYLNQAPGQPEVPQYSVPARTDELSTLPQTWIGIGESDLFFNENCTYAERLKAAGVDCELEIAPLAPHAFEVTVPDAPISQAFVEANHRFVKKALGV